MTELAFPALADPTRRRIVALLARGDRCVRDLLADFAVSQPAISKHLRILRDAGLVEFVRAGREHRYRLRGEALRSAADWMLELHAFWTARLDALGAVLDGEAAR